MRSLALIALAFALAAPASAQPSAPDPLRDVDQVVAEAMKTFQVPGVAIGVVKDGKLVLARGYGVRAIDAPGQVDSRTLFAIGSNTKPFTSAALSLLVEEGKLSWDDRVVDQLPQFRLYDPYVTRDFRIRDLLSHRSGLGSGAGDLMIFPDTDYKRADVFPALSQLQPAAGFRSRYGYVNLMYVVAGELIPAVTGQSWDDFVQTRLLKRLGMERCTASGSRGNDLDIATPHAVVEGRLAKVTAVGLTMAAAAGGIRCDIEGLSKWAAMQLNQGKLPDGSVLLSPKQQREMWSVQISGPVPPMLTALNRTHFRGYGLGWNLEDYEGRLRVYHSGGTLGEASQITLLPEAGVGIIVLTNQQNSSAVNAITQTIAKAILGTGQQDWVALYGKMEADGQAEAAAFDADLSKSLANAGPMLLPAKAYVGTYRDAWRGDVDVTQTGGQLRLKFSHTSRLQGTLHHYQGNRFVVRWDDRSLGADAFVDFSASGSGDVIGMRLESLPSTEGSLDFQNLTLTRVEKR